MSEDKSAWLFCTICGPKVGPKHPQCFRKQEMLKPAGKSRRCRECTKKKARDYAQSWGRRKDYFNT